LSYALKIDKSLLANTSQDIDIPITYPSEDKSSSDDCLTKFWQRLNGVEDYKPGKKRSKWDVPLRSKKLN